MERARIFAGYVIEDNGILKSVCDKRQFKYVRLDNGFQALIICDPKTNGESSKMSAACLCVKIGTFEDPPQVLGLAHLLEHVITMGSKQFPKENVFDDFLGGCGGYNNAHTEYEETFFEFETLRDDFEEALKIFASFFVSPLLKKSSVSKEIKPVEDEFTESIADDHCRQELLFQSFIKEDHPLHKFSWGNKETLLTIPAKNKIDVHKQLVAFWKEYYVASNMALVVQTEHDIEKMSHLVTELFKSVPSKLEGKSLGRVKACGSPFSSEFKRLYYVEPIEKQALINFCWWVPCTRSDYETKPLNHIGSLMGHEGKGSLLSFLREKGLALEMEAGNGGESFEHNIYQSLFTVSIHLTDKGLERIGEIVNYVFTFVEFLQSKGPQKYYFDEELSIDLNHFRFVDETCASSETKKLAKRFFHCPIESIVIRHLASRYDENVIKRCLEHLDRSEANVMIISQEAFKGCSAPVKNEKWTKMKYKVEEIPDEWLQIQQHDTVFEGKVFFPEPNQFIAKDFELFVPEEVMAHPTAIYQTEFCRLWYKGDNKFKRPKACINFIFSTSTILNIRQTIALELFVDILMQNLKDEVYPAYVAGLEYSVSFTTDKQFILRLSGFNDKLPNLVDLIVSKVVNFSVEEKLFFAMKEDIKKSYFNHFVESQKLASSIRHLILQQNYFTAVDKLKHVDELTITEMQEAVKIFFGSLFTECLIQGNFSPQRAESILKSVVSLLENPATFSLSYPQICELPKSDQIVRLKTFNVEEKCSVICNYFQIGPCDIRKFCLLELLSKSMEEPLFDTLRTQQGLGYEVSNWSLDTWGIGGFCILVVSPIEKFTCDHVDESIEKFLKQFAGKIESMSEASFQKLVRSRIQAKSVPDLHLTEECNRNFEEIITRNYCFDRLNREIECLKQISQQEFQRWSLHQILQFPSRRKLSIQVVANSESPSENGVSNGENKVYNLQLLDDKNNANFIKDIASFKKGLSLYPPTFVKI